MEETAYKRWMKAQDIPIHTGYIVRDARVIERRPWAMTGTPAAFIDLQGMEGFSGMQVIEIPPGGATKPMKHLFQTLICVLEGSGSTQIWCDENSNQKAHFEWNKFSLFSPPLNFSYRIFNASGTEPAILLSVSDSPMIMDLFHNHDFVFNNPFVFRDRYSPDDEQFFSRENRNLRGGKVMVWETNLINNVFDATVDSFEGKGSGVKLTIFDMASNSFAGHLVEWPVGKYHKSHHHQGGAILLITRSEGYTLMWPQELGIRPYKNGFSNQIVEVEWGPYSVFSPPTKWFHQHFNVGPETARQLAFRPGGSSKNATGYRHAGSRVIDGVPGVLVSYRQGGAMIDYEDEDPQIRADFERHLKKTGVKCEMPAVQYHDDVR